MTECAHEGCPRDAEQTVVYENPNEELAYCPPCAGYHFSTDSRAIEVRQGVPDGDDS